MNLKKIIIYVFIIITFCNLTSCSSIKSVKDNKDINLNINKNEFNNLIENNIKPPITSSFKGKIFYNCEIISLENNKDITTAYLWLLAQEYYLKNNNLQKGTGGIFPIKITLKYENNHYKFIKYNISKAEGEDDYLFFPKSIREKAKSDFINLDKSFLNEVEKKAESYYLKNN